MNCVWLVFKGWDGPDCSPSLYGGFSSLELAQEFAKELRDENESRHSKDYGVDGGTHEWKKLSKRVGYSNREYSLPKSYEEYWQSYITFGQDSDRLFDNREDDAIYIQRIELDDKNLRNWS